MWKADPEKVKIIDVRTPEEYAFVGHPDECWNIPLVFVTYQRKNDITEYGPKMNPDFVAEVKKIAGPSDTLLLMCRSSGRSAMAVNQLAAAGLKNAYNISSESVTEGVRHRGHHEETAAQSSDVASTAENFWRNGTSVVLNLPKRVLCR